MSWTPTRLKHLAARPVTNGLGESGSEGEPGWPRYVRTTDIAGPRQLRDDIRASLPPAVAQRAPLRYGDIVMTAAGATIGKSMLYTSDDPACYAGYLARFSPKSGVDSRFVAYWMESGLYWAQIQKGKVVSTIENFSASKYANLRLAVPSLGEQRAIADYLDTETARIDALITKKRRLITLLEEQRASVTLAGVSGTHTEFGFETCSSALAWTSERATHFHEVLLRLVADQGTGHTPSRDHPEWWNIEECVVPWITTGEVRQMRSDRIEYITSTREMISEAGIENSSATPHPPGTVVLCRTASAGYSAIMGTEMATSQDFATWTCGALLSPRYLLLCLRAMRSDLLGRLATGSTHKTIYMPDIQALRIPLPTLSDQERIVDWVWSKLRRLDQTGKALSAQLDLLVEHRQALITAAVTGELRVPGMAA